MKIVRWLIGIACAVGAATASAGVTSTFGGGAVSGCSLAGATYSCASLPLVNFDDAIVIATGYTVNVSSDVAFGFNHSLTMSGSAVLKVSGDLDVGGIKPANVHVSGGSFQATGDFSYGAQQQNMTVNVTAASMSLGSGSTGSITGTLTSSGPVSIGSHMTVNGAVSGTTVTTNSPVVINGNVTASTSFSLASGSTMTGNIVAPTVSILPSAVSVTGNISASNSLTIGSGNSVHGDVTAGALTLQSSNATIFGNATVTTATLGSQDRVTQTIYCTAGNAANCGCVADSTGYASGSTNAPSCSAPPAPPSSGPHHLLVSHSGAGVTCAPQTVTVTACANAACSAPHYTGGANVTLTPGGGVFATGATGVNSAATVQSTSAGSVAVSATSVPAASNATVCANTGTGTSSCAMTWTASGFLVSVPSHFAGAGQSATISAVRTDTNTLACTPAFASVSKTVAFNCAYLNPASGTVSVNVGASPGTALACGAGAAGSSSNVALAFGATGIASLPLTYADVGQVRLNASYTGSGPDAGLSMTGSATFIASPTAFAVAIPSLPTPPADATSAAFTKAGQSFTATVTAVNSSGAPTPNFGRESTPETATMSNLLLAPTGGNNPAVSDAASAFTLGVSTRTMSWSEVGIIKLVATLTSTGYLGTANRTTGTSSNVGRFTPAYFATVLGSGAPQPQPCPTGLTCASPTNKFVYSEQPFPVTVTAFNNFGSVTGNYASSATAANAYARTVTLSAWNAPGSTSTANPPASPGGSAMSTNTSTATTFVAGVGTLNPTYTFPAKFPAAANLAPPTNIYVRATDSDAIDSNRAAASTEMGVMVVGGRLAIRHAYGSELIPLTEIVTAQYWNGTRYAASSTDGISGFAMSNVVLFNCQKNLNNGGTSCKPAVAVASGQGPVLLVAGVGGFKLAAPGSGNTGTVDLKVNAPAWLPSATGRITYGIYTSPLIYLQEVY